MTICPRCGRPADDEFVCAGCGAFLATEETGPAPAVSVGRVAVLVLVVCLLGAGGAALLLGNNGGGRQADQSIPIVSSTLSNAPLGSSSESSAAQTSAGPTRHPATSSSATRTRTPSPTASKSARQRRSASRSSSQPAPTSATPTPRPSTSHSTSQPPSSKPPSSPPPPAPQVRLSKGTLATCGPHCFPLVVTLINFSAGSHTVNCFSSHGQFGSYTTSATTSSGCSFSRPNDTVYVIVDGHHSNAVIW